MFGIPSCARVARHGSGRGRRTVAYGSISASTRRTPAQSARITPVARTDWAKALDFTRAAANLRVEMGRSDWHQDPWDWPELSFVLRKEPELVIQHCRSAGTLEPALVDVPKENWGTRPAVVLDLMDRLVYQALVDRLSVELIGNLSPNAYGWRLPAVAPQRGVYSRNTKQWEGYRRHLQTLVSLHEVALRTDLVSFFASLPVDRVQEAIQDRTSTGAITARLFDMLEGFDRVPYRSGLPQRSFASAAIANMYLIPLDDVLEHHSSPMPVFSGSKVRYRSFARWMDDILWFGKEPATARRVQMDLQSEARALGLNLSDAKTEVLEGPDLAHLLDIEHSAVDAAIANNSDLKPLEELVDRLLDDRELASRSSIRFAAKRLQDNGHVYRAQDMVGRAARMPHVADSWAELFKTVFTHASLQDWFLDYADSDWATHEWSIAHFARMFPSGKKPRKQLRQHFANKVRDANTSLPLLAVAAQRLSAWDQTEARASFRDAIKRAPTAHSRRVLSLAALEVGETRTIVRKWLGADKENYPTLRMLETEGYAPRKVNAAYAG